MLLSIAALVLLAQSASAMPKYVDGAGGVRLAYETHGRGPVIILVHGGGMDRRMWDPHVPDLARDFTVVTFDVRGHGQSGRPTRAEDYSMDRYIEDLHRLADAVGAKRFSIWGFSLGASVGINAAARSDRVDRALIAGSHFGRIFTEEMVSGTVSRIRTLLDAQAKGTLDPATLKPNERAAVERGDLPPTLAWLLAAPGWPATEPREVKATMLLYVGSEDTNVIGKVKEREADMKAAGIDVRVLPGLDHMAEVTRMDVVMPIAREFFAPGSSR
jgi:pimeloyl-ACP methyl ester carboxylesterase